MASSQTWTSWRSCTNDPPRRYGDSDKELNVAWLSKGYKGIPNCDWWSMFCYDVNPKHLTERRHNDLIPISSHPSSTHIPFSSHSCLYSSQKWPFKWTFKMNWWLNRLHGSFGTEVASAWTVPTDFVLQSVFCAYYSSPSHPLSTTICSWLPYLPSPFMQPYYLDKGHTFLLP